MKAFHFRPVVLLALTIVLAACSGNQDPAEVAATTEQQPASSLLNPPAGRGANPDVLLIMVDDLNDMIEPLGDSQAITPNISELASRGMTFTNAQSIAPQCNAIRTAALFGMLPSSTGVYNNGQDWREMELFEDKPSLPRYFRDSGYFNFGSGKIFHAHTFFSTGFAGYNDVNAWNDFWPSLDRQLPDEVKPANVADLPFNFGPVVATLDSQIDGMTTSYVVQRMEETNALNQSRFIGAGIYRPHAPWYNPQEFFDLYPLEDVQLPPYMENDLDDIDPAHHDRQRMLPIMEAGLWRDAVQAYLASVSVADAAVGRLLDALDASGRADNTIIVLMGDHGYQLGEKNQREKETLWEVALHVPLIIVAPGITSPGSRSGVPVSSMDLYPTLVDLAGLEAPGHLEGGDSLRPLLEDPSLDWDRVVLSTWGQNNHSVRDARYRYTRYADGAEELYDHDNDPNEWYNLASDPAMSTIKESLATSFPTLNVEQWVSPDGPSDRPGGRGRGGQATE